MPVEEKNNYQCKKSQIQIVTISKLKRKLWRKLIKSKPNEYLQKVDDDINRTNFLEVKYKIKKQESALFLVGVIFSNCWQILISIAVIRFIKACIEVQHPPFAMIEVN